jgi:hypothetical protein
MAFARNLFVGVLLALCGADMAAAEARVTRLIVAVEGPYVRLTFDLEGGFNEHLLTHIESGIASGFAYDLQLLRDRKHFWDARVATATLRVTASYDPVARTFLIRYELDGRLVDSRAVKSRAELEKAMTHIASLPVFETRGLPTDVRHIVAVRAEPTNASVLDLFGRSARTDWIESRKFRIPTGVR